MGILILEAGCFQGLRRDLRFPLSKRTGGMRVVLAGKRHSKTGSEYAEVTDFANSFKGDM